jgi:hypothetical protein
MVMLPVMLYARSLDAEDPNIVLLLRCAYGVATLVTLVVIFLVQGKVGKAAVAQAAVDQEALYVPKAAGMFDDPNGPKKYLKTSYSKLHSDKLGELVQQTGMSMLMTVGLHYYKGMVIGLAMQSVMGPFGLYENPLIQKFLLGKADNAFGEKREAELNAEDSIIEMVGMEEKVIRAGKGAAVEAVEGDTDKKTDAGKKTEPKALPAATTDADAPSLEDILLDCWDTAEKADLPALTEALTRGNVNSTTDELKWTPLMVVSGLKGAEGVGKAVRECKKLGADETATDVEGWTALHWAAYHGSKEAAEALCEEFDVEPLVELKDKESKTVRMLCEEENNMDVWKVIESNKSKASGLKQRVKASE